MSHDCLLLSSLYLRGVDCRRSALLPHRGKKSVAQMTCDSMLPRRGKMSRGEKNILNVGCSHRQPIRYMMIFVALKFTRHSWETRTHKSTFNASHQHVTRTG